MAGLCLPAGRQATNTEFLCTVHFCQLGFIKWEYLLIGRVASGALTFFFGVYGFARHAPSSALVAALRRVRQGIKGSWRGLYRLNRTRSIFVPFLGTKIIFAFFANAAIIFVPKNGT